MHFPGPTQPFRRWLRQSGLPWSAVFLALNALQIARILAWPVPGISLSQASRAGSLVVVVAAAAAAAAAAGFTFGCVALGAATVGEGARMAWMFCCWAKISIAAVLDAWCGS